MTIEPKGKGMPWFPQILLASAAGYGIAKAANCTEVGTVVTIASTTFLGLALAEDKDVAYPYKLISCTFYGGLAVAGDKAVPEYGAVLPGALFMVYSRKEPEVQWACVKYLGVAFAVGFAVKYALSRS